MDAQEKEINTFLGDKDSGKLLVNVNVDPRGIFPPSAFVTWCGLQHIDPYTEAERKGVVRPSHPSFEMYKKKRYTKRSSVQTLLPTVTAEDQVLLDPEAEPDFENIHPGTITIEGFRLECWDFENMKPKNIRIFVNNSKLPEVPASKLLRRIDMIHKYGVFGEDPDDEELNLQEMIGNLNSIPHQDPWTSCLYSFLNRTNGFADFTHAPTICARFMSPPESGGLSIWNFLRQVIMGKALAVRLSRLPDHDDYPGFTARVLGTLIVSDLWLKHVNVVLTDKKVSLDSIKVPDEAERAEAAKWEKKGAEATSYGEYQEAVEHYTKAIVADLTNAMYRCDRSAAQLAQGNYLEAEEDAEIATLLDPKQPKAWSYLGLALMRQGYSRRAEKTYKKALEMVSSDASPAIRQGMDDAQAYSRRTISAINEEQARARRHRLQSDFFAQDYETIGKTVQLHSRVHEQQVEGLLLFAQKLKWPHLDETRAFAEEVYDSVRDSRTINPFLWDWLFGLILPGRWFAYTIMVALLQCTPCIGDKLRDIRYQSSGFALPDRSYWRSRTVLARVLGCLPGVVSLCGWVGPCPAVIFQNQADEGVEQGVQIKARTVTPLGPAPGINPYTYMQVRPGEALSDLHKDLERVENWVVPSPPSQDDHTCEVQEVQLRRLAPDANGNDADKRSEYRASVVFRLDSSPTPITYVLYTNPLFVMLPPCQARDLRQNAGWHDFHRRQLPLYQGKVWPVGELKDYVPEDEHGGHVSTVNATGEGAEVVARAWCSETGRNAAIRRPGGPCLVCAIDAAHSLNIRVLIWVG